ncbi:hypothetical protein [Rhizobium sp. RU36D]|nr:hypothetical protein [Rhizobium sp. RU36D]
MVISLFQSLRFCGLGLRNRFINEEDGGMILESSSHYVAVRKRL